jgi:hypothetical protein
MSGHEWPEEGLRLMDLGHDETAPAYHRAPIVPRQRRGSGDPGGCAARRVRHPPLAGSREDASKDSRRRPESFLQGSGVFFCLSGLTAIESECHWRVLS